MDDDDREYVEFVPIQPSTIDALFIALREDAVRQFLAAYPRRPTSAGGKPGAS